MCTACLSALAHVVQIHALSLHMLLQQTERQLAGQIPTQYCAYNQRLSDTERSWQSEQHLGGGEQHEGSFLQLIA